jgi:hypothetical protein
MTKRDLKYGAVILGLVAAWIGTELYERRVQKLEVVTAPVLKDNEEKKIIIDTNTRTVQVVERRNARDNKSGQSHSTEVVKTTKGVRKVVVTETNDGAIQTRLVNKGLSFEPGVALYCSDKMRVGLDFQVTYFGAWGVLLGAGVAIGDEPRTIRAHVAVSRSLPLRFMGNTQVFVGVDQRKDVVAGLRVRF